MWREHSESASEHQALVSRLTEQLAETEAGYRQAKGVKASLEAELAAAQAQARHARQESAEGKLALAAAQRDAEAAAARAAAELADLKERSCPLRDVGEMQGRGMEV